MFNNYLKTNFLYFSVNKFKCLFLNDVPNKFLKIILTVNAKKNANFKNLIQNLLILEFISMKKQNSFILTKKANLIFNLKQGTPIGCKIILKKKLMFAFLKNFVFDVWPLFKKHVGLNFNKLSFSFNIKTPVVFYKLSYFYTILNNKNNFNFNIVLKNIDSYYQIFFVLKLLNLKKSKCNSMVECNFAKVKAESSNLFICKNFGKMAEGFKALVLKTISIFVDAGSNPVFSFFLNFF